MKNIITIAAIAAAVSSASAQDYLGGLNFSASTNYSADLPFDNGSQANLFFLNIQTGIADDFFSPFGFSDAGWAAQGDIFTNGVNTVQAGQPNFDATVGFTAGFAPSTDLFGGTSANAQGFNSAAGVTFKAPGIFTITSSSALSNAEIAFDAAALLSPGTLTVDSQSVSLSSSASNNIVALGDLAAGDFITFDLAGLVNGANFDNIQIAGTVVPEPSTYAAIVGALALGFVAYRRRNS